MKKKPYNYTIFFISILIFTLLQCQSAESTDKDISSESIDKKCLKAEYFSNYPLADKIVYAPSHTGIGFYNRDCAINGVKGAGEYAGSTDVFSLEKSGEKAEMILEWKSKRVLNTEGSDFIVFENAFKIMNTESTYMDPVVVEVSIDKINWCGFDPDYSYNDENTYSANSIYWHNLAGTAPVFWNTDQDDYSIEELFIDEDNNNVPDIAGGNSFDLDNLKIDEKCNSESALTMQENGFYYIKLISISALTNPDTNDYYITSSISDGADIDGVLAKKIENR